MLDYLPYDWRVVLFQAGEVGLLAAGILTVFANLMLRTMRAEMRATAVIVAEALRVESERAADLVAERIKAEAVLAAARLVALAKVAEDAREQ